MRCNSINRGILATNRKKRISAEIFIWLNAANLVSYCNTMMRTEPGDDDDDDDRDDVMMMMIAV